MTAEDLQAHPTLESTLRDLGASGATGCLVVSDAEYDEAELYLRDGALYAVAVPGRRATLGARLMSSGALSPDALADALEIQRQELQGWRLGELLVHLGYVDREVVEAYVGEQMHDALDDLLGRPTAGWKFRRGKKTRQDVAPPVSVADVLDAVVGRRAAWDRIVAATGGAEGVPQLSAAAPTSDDVILDSNDWALLTRVDGIRTIDQLANDCGFTLHEAGRVVVHLIEAGVVEVALDDEPELPVLTVVQASATDPDPDPEADDEAAADLAEEPDASALAASLSRIAASLAPASPPSTDAPDASTHAPHAELVLSIVAVTDLSPIDHTPTAIPHASDEVEFHREREQRLNDETLARQENERRRSDQADEQQQAEADAEAAAGRRERFEAGQDRRQREAELIATMLEEQAATDDAARAARVELRPATRIDADDQVTEDQAASAQAAQDQAAQDQAALELAAVAEFAAVAELAAEAEKAAMEQAAAEFAAAEQASAERDAATAGQRAREQAERELNEEADRRSRQASDRAEAAREASAGAARQAAVEAEQAAFAQMQRRADEEAVRISEIEAEERRRAQEEWHDVQRRDEEHAERERLERERADDDERSRRQAALIAEAERELEAAVTTSAAGDTAEQDSDDVLVWEEQQSAAAMLRELSSTPIPARIAEEKDSEPEAETQDAAPSSTFFDRGDTDTASLLRELSSLGFGDDGPPQGPTAPAPRSIPTPAAPPPKKRKGLFGR